MDREQTNGMILDREAASAMGSGRVVIPGAYTIIGDGAFYMREDVTEVIISEGVKMCENGAFEGCVNLTYVSIPGSLVFLAGELFRDCTALKKVDIAEGVPDIPYRAFYGCAALETVAVPDSVRWIGPEAFAGCDSLQETSIPKHMTKVFEGDDYSYISVKAEDEIKKLEAIVRDHPQYQFIYDRYKDHYDGFRFPPRVLTDVEIAAVSEVVRVKCDSDGSVPEDYLMFLHLSGCNPEFRDDKIRVGSYGYGDEGILLYNVDISRYECYDMDWGEVDYESDSLSGACKYMDNWDDAYDDDDDDEYEDA